MAYYYNDNNDLNAPTHVDDSDVVESALVELKSAEKVRDEISDEVYNSTEGYNFWPGYYFDGWFDCLCDKEQDIIDIFTGLSHEFNDKTVELFAHEMNFDPNQRENPSRNANNDIAYAKLLTMLSQLQYWAIKLRVMTEVREWIGRKAGKEDPVNPSVPKGYVLKDDHLYDDFPRDAEAGLTQIINLPAELIRLA